MHKNYKKANKSSINEGNYVTIYDKVIDFLIYQWYAVPAAFATRWVKKIKKLPLDRKKWLDERARRISQESVPVKRNNIKKRRKSNKTRVLKAPEIFSLYENPDHTIRYFDSVINEATKHEFDATIFFDLQETKIIKIDAIMYLLAIIQNLKYKTVFRLTFAGNQPRDSEANSVFKESGFLKYVNSVDKALYKTSDKVQIATGKDVDALISRVICDFAIEKLGNDYSKRKILHPALIELMTNTRQHAYDSSKHTRMTHQWYIYTESTSDKVNFTFLDTGFGIPQTVRRNFLEIITQRMPIFQNNDARLIYSALLGEFRTETKKRNRGRGLPYILENACNNQLQNLSIISGNGMCTFGGGNEPELRSIEHQFMGTLFSWSFRKDNLEVPQ